MATARKGRLHSNEKRFIIESIGKMSPEEIGVRLGRATETIKNFIKTIKYKPNTSISNQMETSDIPSDERESILFELKASAAYKAMKEEFLIEEIRYICEEYALLVSQFKNDILPSEKIQLLQAAKYSVLMNRNLKERQKSLRDIERLEKMQEAFSKKFDDPGDMEKDDQNYAMELEAQLTAHKAAEQSRTTEYIKLQEKHASLMKSLKAMRDQRIEAIESSKESMLGFIRAMAEKNMQQVEGRNAVLIGMAASKEYWRLGKYHTYQDGNIDRPILSSDTVDLNDEEENEGLGHSDVQKVSPESEKAG